MLLGDGRGVASARKGNVGVVGVRGDSIGTESSEDVEVDGVGPSGVDSQEDTLNLPMLGIDGILDIPGR